MGKTKAVICEFCKADSVILSLVKDEPSFKDGSLLTYRGTCQTCKSINNLDVEKIKLLEMATNSITLLCHCPQCGEKHEHFAILPEYEPSTEPYTGIEIPCPICGYVLVQAVLIPSPKYAQKDLDFVEPISLLTPKSLVFFDAAHETIAKVISKALELKQDFEVDFHTDFNTVNITIDFHLPIKNEFILFISGMDLDWNVISGVVSLFGNNPSYFRVQLSYQESDHEKN